MNSEPTNVKQPSRHKLSRLVKARLFPYAVSTVLAMIIVVGVHLLWQIPRPLLLFAAACYLLCSLACYFFPTDSQGSIWQKTATLMLSWLAITAILLFAIYRTDKAGWIWFQVTGYNFTRSENLKGRIEASNLDFLSRNPFFSVSTDDSTVLVLKKGEYKINQTIIVPKGNILIIEPGTILRFNVGISLISYRSVLAQGTATEPIICTAIHGWRKWGVVGVVGPGKSIFAYVKLTDGRQALVNEINFPGCLSIIETEVEMRHCELVDIYGKDAVHVRKGVVQISENIVRNAFKDGLDLDGGTGVVCRNQFINCGDEGIDLSDNRDLQVVANEILDTRGGRVAADYNLDTIKSRNILSFYRGD